MTTESDQKPSSAAQVPTVYIVDDDASIRELMTWLMQANGIPAAAFSNAQSFLAVYQPDSPGCLILDLYMPGMSGLDLQRYLIDHGISMPVIFLSGRGDVANAVAAVKHGAIDFIEKPFDYKKIVPLIRDCLARDIAMRHARGGQDTRLARLAVLTQREREVMNLIVAGKTNRVMAETLDISVKTVEAHRAHIMEKLAVDSVAELVQIALSRPS